MSRPEDERKIGRMTVALRLSKERACILLVAFNDEILRQDVEAGLKERLEPEGFNFREFRVTDDEYRNLPIMLVDMNPQPEDIFLIYDLRKALPEVLEYLNYRREDFVEHNISAIFWLDEPTLTKIARKAQDFYAFRSLPVFEFKVDRSGDMAARAQATLGGEITFATRQELDDKLAVREELLSDYLEKMPQALSTIAGLRNELGQLYRHKARYDKALASCQEALKLYRQIEDRNGEADALNSMGNVLHTLDDLEGAKEHYERALAIVEEIYEPNHPKVAGVVSSLGLALHALNDLEGAREHYERALVIDEGIYGKDHPEVARVANNLGRVLQDLGDLEGARERLERALAIDEEIYGRGHPRVAISVNNLGIVLQSLDDLEGAKEHFKRALAIDEEIYGEDHPNVATSVNNLGSVLESLGDLEGAKEHYGRALDIVERYLGTDHHYTQSARRSLERIQTLLNSRASKVTAE